MFKEYITDPIRINGGMDSLGRGLREYVKDKQYSPEIAGDEFGEMVMDVFSQVNTNISRRVEGAAPIPTNHPLSLCLKDRDFEYIVADEQKQAPAHLHIPGNKCYQWFRELQHLLGHGCLFFFVLCLREEVRGAVRDKT